MAQKEESFIGYPRNEVIVPQNYTFSPNMFGAYTELLHGDYTKARELKLLGLDYVILYTYQTDDNYLKTVYRDICLFEEYGLGVILLLNCEADDVPRIATPFSGLKNLIGWYVYDEPSIHDISRERQDKKIYALKQVRNIPCFTTECGAGLELNKSMLSANYDYVYSDVYITGTRMSSNYDLMKYYGLIGKLYSYDLSRILPVYETYWDSERLRSLEYNLNRKRILYGKESGGVFFIYYTGETIPNAVNIHNSNILKNAVVKTISNCVDGRTFVMKGFCNHDESAKVNKKGVVFSKKKNISNDGYLLTNKNSIIFTFDKKVLTIRLYYVLENINKSQIKAINVNNRQILKTKETTDEVGSMVIDNIDSRTITITSNDSINVKSLVCIGLYE